MFQEQLEQHRELLAKASDVVVLRKRMLWCGDTLAPLLFERGTSPDVWRGLGLSVVRRKLDRVRGLLQSVGTSLVVVVDEREHPRLQRFTVAHELGHALMSDVDRRKIGLSTRDEELLCEDFASRLLIPRADLERQMEAFDGDPAEVLRLCQRYDVGLAACLAAIGKSGFAGDWVAFVADMRGHPKRLEEVRLRARRAVCEPFLIPENTSLVSLGLIDLNSRLEAGDRDPSLIEELVELRLWSPGALRRSGRAYGAARARGRRLPNGMAVICVKTDQLVERWAKRRMPPVAA